MSETAGLERAIAIVAEGGIELATLELRSYQERMLRALQHALAAARREEEQTSLEAILDEEEGHKPREAPMTWSTPARDARELAEALVAALERRRPDLVGALAAQLARLDGMAVDRGTPQDGEY